MLQIKKKVSTLPEYQSCGGGTREIFRDPKCFNSAVATLDEKFVGIQ